ncbi:hypothetical protein GGI06_002522, partial [Coemansia sp. S85]
QWQGGAVAFVVIDGVPQQQQQQHSQPCELTEEEEVLIGQQQQQQLCDPIEDDDVLTALEQQHQQLCVLTGDGEEELIEQQHQQLGTGEEEEGLIEQQHQQLGTGEEKVDDKVFIGHQQEQGGHTGDGEFIPPQQQSQPCELEEDELQSQLCGHPDTPLVEANDDCRIKLTFCTGKYVAAPPIPMEPIGTIGPIGPPGICDMLGAAIIPCIEGAADIPTVGVPATMGTNGCTAGFPGTIGANGNIGRPLGAIGIGGRALTNPCTPLLATTGTNADTVTVGCPPDICEIVGLNTIVVMLVAYPASSSLSSEALSSLSALRRWFCATEGAL